MVGLFQLIVLLFIVVSCRTLTVTAKVDQPPAPDENTTVQPQETDSVLSFTIDVWRRSGNDSVAISWVEKVKARMGNDPFLPVGLLAPGTMRCCILGQHLEVVKCQVFDNPLNKIVEYTEGNQTVTLKKKTVLLDRAYFSVRTNVSSSMRYIQVSAMDSNKKVSVYPLYTLY
jgi:hypothetical protein